MMREENHQQMYRLFAILVVLFFIALMQSCENGSEDRNFTGSPGRRRPGVSLKITRATGQQVKVTGITIEVAVVDLDGNPIDSPLPPVVIAQPDFPLDVPITVFVPPCEYQITVTVSSETSTFTNNIIVDACLGTNVDVTVSDSGITVDSLESGEECPSDDPECELPEEECPSDDPDCFPEESEELEEPEEPPFP